MDNLRIGCVVEIRQRNKENLFGKIVGIIGSHIHVEIDGNINRVRANEILGNSDQLIFAGLIYQVVNCIDNNIISINDIIDILIEKRENGEIINVDNINYYCEMILKMKGGSN